MILFPVLLNERFGGFGRNGAEEAFTAHDQTRRSLCICVSFIKQVNPPWHLLSKSLNKNTTEEKSVKPVALTYLTAVV